MHNCNPIKTLIDSNLRLEPNKDIASKADIN